MPPNLDIYVLTDRRDLPTITAFLDRYVNRKASEDRGGEMLSMRRLGAAGEGADAWEEEPALTLTHIVRRGLDHPRRCFTVYLKAKLGVDRVILGFTQDDRVVFGLSIDDAEERPEADKRAKSLLNTLAKSCGARIGLVACEEPPPSSEAEFQKRGRASGLVYFHEY